MPRFANSNRHAAEQRSHTAKRKTDGKPIQPIERCYFRRIGFDFAMI